MVKKFEVLSYFDVIEKHVVELDVPEGEQMDEEILADLINNDNMIRSEIKNWEIINVQETRGSYG